MIESGARPNPESATVIALASAMGIDVGWLLTGSGPEPTREGVRAALGIVEPDSDARPSGEAKEAV